MDYLKQPSTQMAILCGLTFLSVLMGWTAFLGLIIIGLIFAPVKYDPVIRWKQQQFDKRKGN